MRSLYTDDIPGAHPRIRHYEKKLYRFEHSLPSSEPYYSAVPYASDFKPMAYPQQSVASLSRPIIRHESLELRRNRDDLSRSQLIDWQKVNLESRHSRLGSEEKLKRSHLSELGRMSVLQSNTEKLISQPYFPHYMNGPKDHDSNKFTGNRYWNPEKHTEVIFIPRYRKVPEQL